MKKFLIALAVSGATILGAHAQNDAKAKQILTAVSNKYRTSGIIKTDFTFTMTNAKAKVRDSQSGSLYVAANQNKYKVALPKQEIYSDGKTQWTYNKGDNEVTVDNVNLSADALNPAKMFTIYEKGFNYTYAGTKKVGAKTLELVKLNPTGGAKRITGVVLGIDKATNTIRQAVVNASNGSVYTFNVSNFTPNAKVTPAVFSFNSKAHPGVTVEDMR